MGFKRIYIVDDTFFKRIDNEEKAYFLGLLYADGYNNTKRGQIVLGLKEGDEKVLVKFTELIQPGKPLQFIIHKNGSRQYRMVICSREMSKDLELLGVTNKKTFSLKFCDSLESQFFNHFVRGFFDGDGSICLYKTGNYHKVNFNFTSTKDFLHSLQQIFQKEIGFKEVKMIQRFPERNNNIFTLNYSGRIQTLKFREWLYQDATVFFERKKAKFYTLRSSI